MAHMSLAAPSKNKQKSMTGSSPLNGIDQRSKQIAFVHRARLRNFVCICARARILKSLDSFFAVIHDRRAQGIVHSLRDDAEVYCITMRSYVSLLLIHECF